MMKSLVIGVVLASATVMGAPAIAKPISQTASIGRARPNVSPISRPQTAIKSSKAPNAGSVFPRPSMEAENTVSESIPDGGAQMSTTLPSLQSGSISKTVTHVSQPDIHIEKPYNFAAVTAPNRAATAATTAETSGAAQTPTSGGNGGVIAVLASLLGLSGAGLAMLYKKKQGAQDQALGMQAPLVREADESIDIRQAGSPQSGNWSAPVAQSSGAPSYAFLVNAKNTKRSMEWLPRNWGINIEAPAHLDGSIPGDVGFDPLNLAAGEKRKVESGLNPFNLAGTQDKLDFYRDAEIKHGRIAMLAAAGWPLSEVVNPALAKVLGLASTTVADGRAPSLLNGGLFRSLPIELTLLATVIVSIIIETQYTPKLTERKPGALGFDPLKLAEMRAMGAKKTVEEAIREMELAEIKHGRIAMIAITLFAFEEAIKRMPVA